ncbi:CcmD family protein [Salmonirosea aquatica]|uniref:CcmD family protein n=1 Tax=Salmonirosea aquatica TaxID=2654236 RepID=A0A7C9BDC6_9BACT|nr:CcmD family protein [Cytophagaceae bacterium SJW1-29]
MKRVFSLLLALNLISLSLFAQQSDVAMADQMRADGKIWVVVGVIALIFAGIITYLVRLDSKLTKLEKDLNIK